MNETLRSQWREFLALKPGARQLADVLRVDDFRNEAWPLFLELKPSTELLAEVASTVEGLHNAAWDALLMAGPTNDDLSMVVMNVPALADVAWQLLCKRQFSPDDMQIILAHKTLWRAAWDKYLTCNPPEYFFLGVLMDESLQSNRELCIAAGREAIRIGLYVGDLEFVLKKVPELHTEVESLLEPARRREQLLVEIGVHEEQSDTCRLS